MAQLQIYFTDEQYDAWKLVAVATGKGIAEAIALGGLELSSGDTFIEREALTLEPRTAPDPVTYQGQQAFKEEAERRAIAADDTLYSEEDLQKINRDKVIEIGVARGYDMPLRALKPFVVERFLEQQAEGLEDVSTPEPEEVPYDEEDED